MIRWKLLLSNFLLVILVIILSIYFINIVSAPYNYSKLEKNYDNKKTKDILNVPKLGKKQKPNLVTFKDVVDRDLFRPDRKEFKVDKPEETEESNEEQPNFIVRGITIFGNSFKAAIVEKLPSKQGPTKPAKASASPSEGSPASIAPKVYKLGDAIDTTWIVKNIYQHKVEFCHGSNCFTVSLYKTYEDANYIPPKQASEPPDRSATFRPGNQGSQGAIGTQGASSMTNQPATSQPPEFTAEDFKRLIQQGGKRKP
jgi:hypothetical protein